MITDKIEDIARGIAGLTSLHDYELTRRHSFTIRDTYYDTPDGFLTGRKISFRTRRSGSHLLVSVKSKPTSTTSAGSRRLEMERPLTREAVRAIARQLGLKEVRTSENVILSRNPSDFFADFGLEVVQERITRRKSRDIADHVRGVRHVFAELDIDDVTYKLDSREVRLLELEIEAKTATGIPKMRRVAEVLLSKYRNSLRLWAHGKFVTGLTIQKLLKSGRLRNLRNDGLLGAEEFDPIDRLARARAR